LILVGLALPQPVSRYVSESVQCLSYM
jgi:hypothetical protein